MRRRRIRKPRDVHHRKPRSRGGTDHPSNLVKVYKNEHQAWHLLFANYSPETVARIINEIWLDPDYELVVYQRRRKVA